MKLGEPRQSIHPTAGRKLPNACGRMDGAAGAGPERDGKATWTPTRRAGSRRHRIRAPGRY